jgi:hypothetical protein
MNLSQLSQRTLLWLTASVTAGVMIACQHSSHQGNKPHGNAVPLPHATANSHGHADHPGGQPSSSSPQAQAKLISPSQVSPNQPVPITIEIQNAQGQPISKFDQFQEQLMHLIVVSNDFHYFNHIHPEYQQKGRFTITMTVPRPGGYTLFSDYKPSQQSEIVSTLNLQAKGPTPSPPSVDFRRTRTAGNLTASLAIAPTSVKAKQVVTLTFNLVDAQSLLPITDLKPYLGERGHLVILRQSPTLSSADYIHAHALLGAQNGQVQFQTTFPEPGLYKLWGQFNRNDQIITVDFWVEVI